MHATMRKSYNLNFSKEVSLELEQYTAYRIYKWILIIYVEIQLVNADCHTTGTWETVILEYWNHFSFAGSSAKIWTEECNLGNKCLS